MQKTNIKQLEQEIQTLSNTGNSDENTDTQASKIGEEGKI